MACGKYNFGNEYGHGEHTCIACSVDIFEKDVIGLGVKTCDGCWDGSECHFRLKTGHIQETRNEEVEGPVQGRPPLMRHVVQGRGRVREDVRRRNIIQEVNYMFTFLFTNASECDMILP
jgi:hypothetical protein